MADALLTPCPKCGAPCTTKVEMRGGDHGWGTTDAERTTYRWATPSPPVAAPPATPLAPVAWGAFYFGGKHDGKLYSHCPTEPQIMEYIATVHQSNDSITLRHGPLYAAAQPQPQPAQPPYYFRRFVRGQERAEDVLVEKAATLDEAIKTAARICPAEAMTVLVLAPAPAWAITAPSTPTPPPGEKS